MKPRERLAILGGFALLIAAMTTRRKWAEMVGPDRIRTDRAGLGTFGAPRGHRTHQGTDLVVQPGAPVYSPISGIYVRTGQPYASGGPYRLAVLSGEGLQVKVMYLQPLPGMVPGVPVKRGQLIGYAQDVSARYPGQGMTPHIHVEVRQTVGDRLLNPEQLLNLT